MNPETIGPYQILGELGRGGMGVVYHGRDPAIGRPVAIKVIRVEPGATADQGAELRRRLIREASAAGKLSHPGIVTIYQLGEDGQDVFVAMEYVEGTSLERLLADKTSLDHARIVDIIQQIAEALDYAHHAGVVHRDVKPANILVREDGRVKVLDFGIAKMIQDQARALTSVGVSLGSPAYMSPEQVRAEQIDGRSDQFSLGIVAYLLLTGRLPFTGDTAHSVMFQIVSAEPLNIQETCAHLPARMTAALARAMAKNSNDRFPSCSAFAEELAATDTSSTGASEAPTVRVASIPATPPPPAATAAPPRRSFLLPAIVALLLVAGGGGYWIFHNKAAGSVTSPSSGEAKAFPKTESPLVKAIAEDRIEDAKKLIAQGADVNAPNPDGTTALMKAAEGPPNYAPLVTLLLDKHADVDAQDGRGWTALYRAVHEGRDEAVRLLLAHKADPNKKANDGSTPLFPSVNLGRPAALKAMLDNGADVNVGDNRGVTPLMFAAQGAVYMPNSTPLMQALLDKGAKIDAQDSGGRTALGHAAAEGRLEPARLLLDKKANPNSAENNGATPLILAATYGRQPLVELLIERGAAVDQADTGGSTPLMIAAEGAATPNNVPMVTALLAANAKVDLVDGRGRSAMFRAAAEGKQDAVRLLIDKKANPNLKASDGTTALFTAVTVGKLLAATVLLDHGADPNIPDTQGSTPLMIVAESNLYNKAVGTELLTLLLKHGAKTDLTDARGHTALDRATESKNTAAIEMLKK